jgi:Co/Zn/Cd efflux system component
MMVCVALKMCVMHATAQCIVIDGLSVCKNWHNFTAADVHGGGQRQGSDDGSDDGYSTSRNHNHNASLQGIEMHIIADVLQQVGLTIAGAILWYAYICYWCCACRTELRL